MSSPPNRAPQEEDVAEGLALLMALFSVVRRIRALSPDEVIDLPSMYVLYQVLVQPGIRGSDPL